MPTIERFLMDLGQENPNALGFSENLYAGRSRESNIRKHNLLTYLKKMKTLNPKLLLLGEAPGYKGCRYTGIPFSSEYILAYHPFFKGSEFRYINKRLETEQSSTIVWEILQDFNIKPLIWNIYPFHPYDGISFNTNRTPNDLELEKGKNILLKLLQIFKIETIAAVGRKPESKIKDLGINYQYIRHPANGGKNQFAKGIKEIMEQA